MKSIHIFFRTYGTDNEALIYMFWQGQLHKNAMDPVVCVICLDMGDKLVLADLSRECALFGKDAECLGRGVFCCNIGF